MSRIEKEIDKLKSKPKNFTYDEMKKIELHKPHPKNILKSYQIKQILDLLEEWRLI